MITTTTMTVRNTTTLGAHSGSGGSSGLKTVRNMYQIVPEPSCLTLLAVSSLVMVVGKRRKTPVESNIEEN